MTANQTIFKVHKISHNSLNSILKIVQRVFKKHYNNPRIYTTTLNIFLYMHLVSDFKPFDLESWWGKRLFNNITKSLWDPQKTKTIPPRVRLESSTQRQLTLHQLIDIAFRAWFKFYSGTKPRYRRVGRAELAYKLAYVSRRIIGNNVIQIVHMIAHVLRHTANSVRKQ